MAWTVWQQDLTDRRLSPIADAGGHDPEVGLSILWSRTLDEGVHSDGRSTQLVFSLEDEETKVRVQLATAHPGQPQATLAILRSMWKEAAETEREEMARALGRFHHLRRGTAIDFFYRELHPIVAGAATPADLVAALAEE